MTAYELKRKHIAAVPDSHFFDKATLRFFGEKLYEMRVNKDGNRYVLISKQHNYPGGCRIAKHYFNAETFEIEESI